MFEHKKTILWGDSYPTDGLFLWFSDIFLPIVSQFTV